MCIICNTLHVLSTTYTIKLAFIEVAFIWRFILYEIKKVGI